MEPGLSCSGMQYWIPLVLDGLRLVAHQDAFQALDGHVKPAQLRHERLEVY